ncbi:AAA family ATPase [Methylocystis iwaonis]
MQLGATLIVFSGLPGTGKSSLAREIARRLGVALVTDRLN